MSAATQTLNTGALLQQTGGANTAATLSIASGAEYLLAGGTLQVSGSLTNLGTFAGGAGGTLLGGDSAIFDLSQGTLQNVGSMSVDMGANSLLLLPAGFNPTTGFGSYSSLGLTHVVGTTLTVPAGFDLAGSVTLNDPVICQGTISGSGNGINLNNGLVVSGNGSVSLGNGSLTVNDSASGISGGSLSAANQYIGNSGTGIFTQSGGTNAVGSGNLYLGYNTGDSGTYNLSAGTLTVANRLYVGYSGTGTFTQSGGTSTTGWSYLGFNSGSSGTYNLSGTAAFSPQLLVVGYSGAGVFTQSGGTVTTPNIYLGNNNNSGSTGTYTLSGGTVSASYLYLRAPGTGTFTQSGGATTLSGGLYIGGGPTGIGTYNLSGTATLSAPTECLGYNYNGNGGTGTFTQSGGVNTVAGSLYLGYNAASQAAYVLSGAGPVVGSQRVHRLWFRRNRTVPTDRRREHRQLPFHRQRRHLSVGRRHASNHQRRTGRSGHVRRRRRRGPVERHQLHHGPLAGNPEKHRRHVGDRGGQRATVVARRNERVELRQLHRPGPGPHGRNHPHGAGRQKRLRLGFDQRPGRLPRHDRGLHRRLDQPEQRVGALGQQRLRQPAGRFTDRQRRRLGHDRRDDGDRPTSTSAAAGPGSSRTPPERTSSRTVCIWATTRATTAPTT